MAYAISLQKIKWKRQCLFHFIFGRSVIIGLGKIQSYQWFCMQQARGSYPIAFVSKDDSAGINGAKIVM